MKGCAILIEKRRGNIRYGKDYYVSNKYLSGRLKIFLIFNRLGVNQKTIYDAIVKALGKKVEVDINVYNNNFKVFKKLLTQKRKEYTHYIISPHFIENLKDYEKLIEQIPKEKLIIIGEDIEGISGDYGAVIENFGKNIFTALESVNDKLKEYKKLTLIFSSDEHPEGMKEGFVNFCKEQQFHYDVISNFENHKIESGEVFIIPDDHFLIDVIDQSKKQKLIIGKDFGIISYNDSPLKEFIAGGLTTISTDYIQMGKSAARLVLGTSRGYIENSSELVQRGSL